MMEARSIMLFFVLLLHHQQTVFGQGDFLKGVEMKCRDGFDMFGSRQLSCSGEKWSIKVPECKPRCSNPGIPGHGFLKNSSLSVFKHGDRVTFGCDDAYTLQGQQTIECRDGRWSHDIPKCLAVECGDPGMPIHGSRTPNKRKYVYQDRVRFRCKTNYTMVGKTDLTCQHDGQWSGYKAFCLAPCNDPGIPKDGIRLDHTFLNGQSVRFRCKSGRQMTGSPYITCNDGRWSNVIPSCHRPCQEPGSPFKGNKIGHDYRHGKTVSYTCQKGRRLVGASNSTCNEGRWSSAVPTCMDNCKKPDKPLNGSMVGNDFSHGQQVSFQCHNGFRLRGNRTMVCYNGRWNSTIPTCIGFCPPLGVPINGTRLDSNFDYNARVRFQCDSGYDIRGPTTLVCVNGKWNNRIPVCKERCKDPRFPRNGRRRGNNFGHHMSVEFFCNNGYDLVGLQSIRCEDGRWSGLTPTCKGCGSALGMENNTIPDGNIRASSVRDMNHQAKDGRLNGPRAWCSGSENSPYIEIDFGKPYQLTSLATQGSAVDNRWVGFFVMKINLAGSRFTSYREHNTDKMFQGNTDGNSVIRNRFTQRIIARRIRLYPLKVGGFLRQPACMRVEIYGCDLPLDCVMIKSRVVAKWVSNIYGGYIYYKAYLTAIKNRVWKVELENERHGNPKYKNILKYEDLPFVLDVPPRHEELQVGTRVLAPWGVRYYTGTIETARDSNNRYQVRADDNDRATFTIDQIRLLKAPTFCN